MKGLFHIALVLILVLHGVSSSAQQDKSLTRKAVQLAMSHDLVGARTVIDQAIATEDSLKPYTWYVHGFIYKEIFKEIENLSINSENREVAVSSIVHCRKLDHKGELLQESSKALEFLAKSYFNHAKDMIDSQDPEWLGQAEGYFMKFKEVTLLYDPLFDATKDEIAFYKSLAQSYERIYDRDRTHEEFVDLGIVFYKKALELNPEDYETNYNTAINFYNRSVHRIKEIDQNTEIFELLLIQDECIQLFKKSLPYMIKAHKQNPQRKETLIGLMAIYRALNEYEKSELYKETLTGLIEQGVITDE